MPERKSRRLTWEDADKFTGILCKIAREAIRVILALHGIDLGR